MTLTRPSALLVVLLAACSACGDDGGTSADAAPPDPCAPLMTLKGEYVDWDSGGTGGFLGIFGATYVVRSDASISKITPPNGRLEACIPAADGFIDITPASGSGYVAGTIVVNRAAFLAQPEQSYRSFKDTRAADFGFSPSLAHVYVHVVGGSRTVTTAATPGTMQVLTGGTWAPGNTGTDIYLGNIPVSAQTMLTVTGGKVTGPTTIPLSTGAFTYVTLVAN